MSELSEQEYHAGMNAGRLELAEELQMLCDEDMTDTECVQIMNELIDEVIKDRGR